jgi:hypothetical protein
MSADEDQSESVAKRRRPFGGQPSRVELYVIAVVVFLLAVGGVSGAVVVSSNDSVTTTTSAPASPSSAAALEAGLEQSAGSGVATETTARPPSNSGNSQSTNSSVVRDEALQRVIDQQIEAERVAKVRADYIEWAKSNPITRIDGVQVLSQTCAAPNSEGENSIQIRFSYTNFGNAHFIGAADAGNNGKQYRLQPQPSESPGSHSDVITLLGPGDVRSGLVLFGQFFNQNPASATEPVPSARNTAIFRVPINFSC